MSSGGSSLYSFLLLTFLPDPLYVFLFLKVILVVLLFTKDHVIDKVSPLLKDLLTITGQRLKLRYISFIELAVV